jgi:SAM-dependent methyltransferase
MERSVINRETLANPIDAVVRCLDCRSALGDDLACSGCGRKYTESGGILEAIGTLSGRNRIAAAFYDGPGWKRFRPWEQAFLRAVGGVKRARMEILRHVIDRARVAGPVALEVGIGNGENIRFLPSGWSVFGVDIARVPLSDCIRLHPELRGCLAWSEGEYLPFDDATFDAVWSVGGFNYFDDHERALREIKRVTKPGGPVVVADEIPGLHRAGLGHLIGVPSFDSWWLRLLGLDREFAEMALGLDFDPTSVIERVWPKASRLRIWRGLGYCYLDFS